MNHHSYQDEINNYTLYSAYCVATLSAQIKLSGRTLDVQKTVLAPCGIFDAIRWEPYRQWEVASIDVLYPIAFLLIRCCEVASMAHTKREHEENVQLRRNFVLSNVRYRQTAEMEVFSFGD